MNTIPAPLKEKIYTDQGVMAKSWVQYFLDSSKAITITTCSSATPSNFNLPSASTMTNKILLIYNEGAGDVTILTSGTETINGATSFVLGQYESVPIISNGTNWFIF